MHPPPERSQLLARTLPVTVGAYEVLRLWSGEPGDYTDYEARHVTLGHPTLFRHELWPSRLNHELYRTDWIAPREALGNGMQALEGLRRARRLQAELQHPRVVPVVDFFQSEGEWFSVFASLSRARNLNQLITAIRNSERPPCSLAEFAALSAGVTEGLAAIHRAGFVHRSLGAHNISVFDDDHVRLADLGCATPIGADDDAARAFRWFMRPDSAAPEQLSARGIFSPATDCWALGTLLFELRYGRHPFWEVPPASLDGYHAAIERAPTFPSLDADAAESLLQPWLRRLLEPAPERRYADAQEAQRDLQAIVTELEGLPPIARAFVAMPFSAVHDPLWRALRAACATCRVAATRVDQSHLRDNIWDEVCDTIRACDLVIAVASSHVDGYPNPNVMLEIGYARALHKPVLLLSDNAETLPFDLRTQRALVYKPEAVGGGSLHHELVSFISGIVSSRA